PLKVYRHVLIAVPQDTLYYTAYSSLVPLNAHLTIEHEFQLGSIHFVRPHFLGAIRSISADGMTIVSGSWDNSVKVWDTRIGECIWALEGHTFSVAISADGETVVSGSGDNTVTVSFLTNKLYRRILVNM
ncbi:UNVERIFIED_CONTAM: hypothetical protein HDU68_012246, partial [Siphonaria sp. JEL0065]